jgi:hypothetical protein
VNGQAKRRYPRPVVLLLALQNVMLHFLNFLFLRLGLLGLRK